MLLREPHKSFAYITGYRYTLLDSAQKETVLSTFSLWNIGSEKTNFD